MFGVDCYLYVWVDVFVVQVVGQVVGLGVQFGVVEVVVVLFQGDVFGGLCQLLFQQFWQLGVCWFVGCVVLFGEVCCLFGVDQGDIVEVVLWVFCDLVQ